MYDHGVVYTAGVWTRGGVLRVCDTGVVYRGCMVTGLCTAGL